jgi:hypothetical protein
VYPTTVYHELTRIHKLVAAAVALLIAVGGTASAGHRRRSAGSATPDWVQRMFLDPT